MEALAKTTMDRTRASVMLDMGENTVNKVCTWCKNGRDVEQEEQKTDCEMDGGKCGNVEKQG